MSLVSALRDYIDLINSSFDSVSANTGINQLVVPTLLYLVGSLKHAAVYLLSFQWLRDLVQLPLLVPRFSLSTLKGDCYPLENPVLNFFTFLEEPAYNENRLLIGFLNSLFASLPVTAAHVVAGRRLLVQGIPAGVAAGSGILLGQWWFLTCVTLGLRSFLLPWLSLEPLNYLLGLALLIGSVYRIAHQRRIRTPKWTDREELLQYFVMSFLLTWCEQTTIFQYLGNLALGAGSTALEGRGGYLIGFLFGSCLFAYLFGCLAFVLRRAWVWTWSMTSSRLTNQMHRAFLVLLVAFSLASVPYYGIDYLLTNKLGFLPQDKALDRTILAPSTIEDISKHIGRMTNFKSFDTDVSAFDRGTYLLEYQTYPQSFEDLNYQGEYGWTKRIGKAVKHLLRTNSPLSWHKLLGSQEIPSDLNQPAREGSYDWETDNTGRTVRGNTQPDRDGLTLATLSRVPRDGGNRSVDHSAGDKEEKLRDQSTVSRLLALENEVAGTDFSGALSDEPNSGISSMAEPLDEDNDVENEFLELFDTGLSPLFIGDIPEPSQLQRSLKRKFVENPVYRLLLRFDIDSFLHRQPASHCMSPLDETALFQRRQVIGHYYNTLRHYNQLQNWEDFQALLHGSKSYANRVYNHQFKGTLKVVRRLFSIGLDPEGSLTSNRVLKFDQPLFQDDRRRTDSHLHEELAPFKEPYLDNSPFLEVTNPKPLYAGWDEELRKLVLTNRSLPRSEALYQTRGLRSGAMINGPYNRVKDSFARDISFTAWPIPEKRLTEPRSQSEIPYQVAFEASNDPQKEQLAEALHSFAESQDQGAVGGSTWDMSRWPANLRLFEQRPGPMPSTRGGFVWPGHSQLKIKIGRGGLAPVTEQQGGPRPGTPRHRD